MVDQVAHTRGKICATECQWDLTRQLPWADQPRARSAVTTPTRTLALTRIRQITLTQILASSGNSTRLKQIFNGLLMNNTLKNTAINT
jgi:hypothetical protein